MKLIGFLTVTTVCIAGAQSALADPRPAIPFDIRCQGSVGLMKGLSYPIDQTLHWNGAEKNKLVLAEGLPGKSGEISAKIRPDAGDGSPTLEIFGWYVDGYKNVSAKGSALSEVSLQHQDAVTGREIDLKCKPQAQAPAAGPAIPPPPPVAPPPLPHDFHCEGIVTEHFDDTSKHRVKHVRKDFTWNTIIAHRELLSAHFPTRGGEFSLRLTPATVGTDGDPSEPAQMAIEAWYIDRTKNTDARGTPYQPVHLLQIDAQKNRKIEISCRPIS